MYVCFNLLRFRMERIGFPLEKSIVSWLDVFYLRFHFTLALIKKLRSGMVALR